ncbi:hypothetical protein CVT25_004427 [Psilocybe cyanescens]|uniref:Uncharacterized protein n=1 Tax=Psilocybe cyanescens TaxID=93625 RepID=A0A409XVY3_PSICY|nr:hypothetical protein CVT25_004427 [Psilocybe cyanescens]
MPRKRKATLSRQSNIQVAIAKRRRFRAGNIDISDEDNLQRLSGDESMNNSDNEDALAQLDASTSQSGELSFQLDIEQGTLDAAPQEGTFLQWDLITDAAMIDGAGEEGTAPAEVLPDDLANGVLKLDNEPGEIDDLGEHEVLQYGQVFDAADTIPIPLNPAPSLPQPAPPIPPSAHLKGYEYSEFRPQRYDCTLLGEQRLAPTQADALKALADLQKVLHPARDTGRGYKDPDMDLWHRARIEGMLTMLNLFTNDCSLTYNCWGASACQAAVRIGRGRHCARRLCDLNRQYLADREVLPINPYGNWNESLLVNEDIVNEINIYLLSLGNEITAKKLMDLLHRPDIKEKYGIEHDISHKTACRYLHTLGYRFQYTPKGQYIDGHEREDVVAYCKNVFLVKWRKYANRMASWDKELREHLPPQGTSQEILEQANDAITILQECYPEYDHVLIYDNATTHLKRPDDMLSAKKMPKGTPKPGTNWGIEVSKRNPVTGNIV